jgi:hypothetical protein
MTKRSSSVMRSSRVRGTLWLVAALPMLVGPALLDGSKSAVGIGIMFLIFGLVTLRTR